MILVALAQLLLQQRGYEQISAAQGQRIGISLGGDLTGDATGQGSLKSLIEHGTFSQGVINPRLESSQMILLVHSEG